ncbi:hypothetical protein PINS_up011074 [Pythium insidiosum]|nr:hypothetical protein PINS_up011074 [Pythium insidiosum]
MFSDMQHRSPAWPQSQRTSPSLGPTPPMALDYQYHHQPLQQHQVDVQPQPQPQPMAMPTSSCSMGPSSAMARPAVQPGWFPLQDTSVSETPPNSFGAKDSHLIMDPMMASPVGSRHPSSMSWPGDPSAYMQDAARSLMSRTESNMGFAVYPNGVPSGYHHPSMGNPAWHDDHARLVHPMASSAGTVMGHIRSLSLGSMDDLHMTRSYPHGIVSGIGVSPRLPSMAGYGSPRKKNQREISIGRWTSDEHRVFLKGLEIYQGPAWGEIARMIGTRTSTQVRTHAQKFFTKLARTNQTLPHFEAQIEKERTRLVAQGSMAASRPSVTPTSTTTHSFVFNTMSPPRKRGLLSPGGPLTGSAAKRDMNESYTTTPLSLGPAGSFENPPALRLPPTVPYASVPESSQSAQLASPMVGAYTLADTAASPYRDPLAPYHSSVPTSCDWSDGGSTAAPGARQPWSTSDGLVTEATPSNDPESLPSVNKLLQRSTSN